MELLMAMAMHAGAPPSTSPGESGAVLRMENVRIVAVGPRPEAGSGIFAVYADFDVAAGNEAPQRMYQLWMGVPDEFLAVTGMTCTITYRRQPLAGGNLHRPAAGFDTSYRGPVNVVQRAGCRYGRPAAPPAAQRGRPSAR